MKFDKSKVYTAVNADELKVGSEVILANYLESLKNQVEANSWPTYTKKLTGVMGTSSTNRFKAGDQTYNLAYFVSEPEEKWIVYLSRELGYKPHLSKCREDKWRYKENICNAKTQLFIGNEEEVDNWANQRMKFSEVIKAWEDGKTIQAKHVKEDKWMDVVANLSWDLDYDYRVKPEEVDYPCVCDEFDETKSIGKLEKAREWWNLTNPQIGQIEYVLGDNSKIPDGWYPCDGRELPKDLIGKKGIEEMLAKYGGRLPDMRLGNCAIYLGVYAHEKVLKWTDLKVKDVIKKDKETRLVISIDGVESNHDRFPHINAGGYWMTDEELEEWEKE